MTLKEIFEKLGNPDISVLNIDVGDGRKCAVVRSIDYRCVLCEGFTKENIMRSSGCNEDMARGFLEITGGRAERRIRANLNEGDEFLGVIDMIGLPKFMHNLFFR